MDANILELVEHQQSAYQCSDARVQLEYEQKVLVNNPRAGKSDAHWIYRP